MAFWRKKNDEFEWNKYVRTTVLARRKERRQKLEDAGAAAIFGVRQARWKSAAHAKAFGKGAIRAGHAAGRAVHQGSRAGWRYLAPRLRAGAARTWTTCANATRSTAQGLGRALASVFQATTHFLQWRVVPTVRALSQGAGARMAPVRYKISTPQIFAPLCLIAAVTTVGAFANWWRSGATQETLFVIGLALSLLGLVVWASPRLPASRDAARFGSEFLRSVPRRAWVWGAGVSGAIMIAGTAIATNGFGLTNAKTFTLPKLSLRDAVPTVKLPDLNPFKSETITGRARTVGPGALRVKHQVIRLDSIEALLPAQTCKNRRKRTWRCGRDARTKLARIARAGAVTCTVSDVDADGVKRGHCKNKNGDVAGQLVAQGYAYADVGIFARYRDQEKEAQTRKRGVWQGVASRPSDYRLAKWDQAAKTAPGGCPIKGRVIRRKRIYALPWDRGYSRMRIRARRGERWFCSEKEARTAGFSRRQDT